MPNAIDRFGQDRSPVQKTGTDKIFGNGSDGNVTISANTSLSRDMYYNTLTVNSGITLFTNGFKIFVKETLTNNGTIGMPTATAQTTTVMAGSVMTRIDGTAGYISGDAISGTLTLAEVRNMDSLIEGIMQKGANRRVWFAGAAGVAGTSGTANAGGGSGANAGTAGTGGSAGQGGGSVLVLAKSISGSGTFVSEGTAGTSGNPGASGNSVSGNSAHNPGGHAPGHNPGGHAPGHNPGGSGHNPPGHYHQAGQQPHAHEPGHHQAPNCQHTPYGHCAAHHPGHHNPGHHYSHHNPSHQHTNPGNAFSHPGNPFHYSHPGNPFHNPSHAGGTANPGNSGNPGNAGSLIVMTRGITTHIASSNLTYVEDLDD